MSLTFRREIDDSRHEEVGLCPVEEDNVRVHSRGCISPDRERYRALGFGEKPHLPRLLLRSLDRSPEMELSRFFFRYPHKGEKAQSACSFVSSIEPDGIRAGPSSPQWANSTRIRNHDIQA
jgi:hypothetical protein